MPDSVRIAHVSDVHFGRIAHPAVVEALLEDVNRTGVDLVAVSGDLTQRARPEQFEAAHGFLERFEAPTLVVPGNHDVYPWWWPFRRLARPLGRYREYISDDLRPRTCVRGVAVFGLNSAFGWTVKGGRVRQDDLEAMRSFYDTSEPGDFRVLVVHHHLTKLGALGPHDVARGAAGTLGAVVKAGVDLVLCGHLHISHIEPVEIVPADHRLVIASAGTATSDRGRRHHRGTNFYNVVTVTGGRFHIEERIFDPAAGGFRSEMRTDFKRVPA